MVGDNSTFLCPDCNTKARDAWDAAVSAQAPFPHRMRLRRNARNTFSPYSAWEGKRENITGKLHRFAGLSKRPDKLEMLSGSEHEVWVADWRAKELEVGPYKRTLSF